MDDPLPPLIILEPSNLKPIRCKGRIRVSGTMSRPTVTRCSKILALTDGVTIVESDRVKVLNEVSRLEREWDTLIEAVRIRGLENSVVNFWGLHVPRVYDRLKQEGRSLVYACKNCGKERKVVGIQFRFSQGQNLFDILELVK